MISSSTKQHIVTMPNDSSSFDLEGGTGNKGGQREARCALLSLLFAPLVGVLSFLLEEGEKNGSAGTRFFGRPSRDTNT
jgi:hypothetical protein